MDVLLPQRLARACVNFIIQHADLVVMTNGEVHICPMCQEEFESEEALQEPGDEEHQDHDPENESGPEGTGL